MVPEEGLEPTLSCLNQILSRFLTIFSHLPQQRTTNWIKEM